MIFAKFHLHKHTANARHRIGPDLIAKRCLSTVDLPDTLDADHDWKVIMMSKKKTRTELAQIRSKQTN